MANVYATVGCTITASMTTRGILSHRSLAPNPLVWTFGSQPLWPSLHGVPRSVLTHIAS